jgi:hypothetical protein
MNRRTFLKTVPALGILAMAKPTLAQAAAAAGAPAGAPPTPDAQGIIKLNPPDLAKPFSLMQSLKNRKSTRDYTTGTLSLQQLSNVLWAADGTSRPDNKRTAPAAMGIYSVDIYAFLPDGIYLYDPQKHQLSLVVKGDNRKAAGGQDFVASTALNLVYVSNPTNQPARGTPAAGRASAPSTPTSWAPLEIGCMVQNVYLYCAAEGLGSVVRGMFDANTLATLLKLKPEQIIITQTVGFPK